MHHVLVARAERPTLLPQTFGKLTLFLAATPRFCLTQSALVIFACHPKKRPAGRPIKKYLHLIYIKAFEAKWTFNRHDAAQGEAMRLTTRTNLAMRTLMYCAVNPGHLVRKHEIAVACGASENHLAQVIHLLAREGFLKTLRGRSGGLTLALPAEEIRVGTIFRQFEGVLPFTDCSDDNGKCPLAGACRLKCILSDAVEGFYVALDRVTLADLVLGNQALERLLSPA